ncbi:MAG: alpha/beta hydrolase [Prevotella sp.]
MRFLACLLAVFSFVGVGAKVEKVHIWEGTEVKADGVTIQAYLPDGVKPQAAVIVCPGGSYHWHAMESEGREVAEWLRQNGMAAFVLDYRVAGAFSYITHSNLLFRGNRFPNMICDLQRAIMLVRMKMEERNVADCPLGVMGFSAGGHLAMMSALMCGTNYLAASGIEPTVSLRPDFVASIYPVVTMVEKCVHKRSRKGLLGESRKRNRQLRDSLSLERHVTADCPPVFLVNCKDDPIVDYRNSELLDSALTANGVPHRYIQYSTGGHGFGVRAEKKGLESAGWTTEFLKWFKYLKHNARSPLQLPQGGEPQNRFHCAQPSLPLGGDGGGFAFNF